MMIEDRIRQLPSQLENRQNSSQRDSSSRAEMTISYSGNFCGLLLRWKGSLWRSVWKELLIYLVMYYSIRVFYLIGIDYIFEDDDDRDKYRWWRQFECLSWPEDILSMLCTVIHANDETSQRRRHMIARYINLSTALAWRDISKKIRLRFPNVSNFVEAGLLTEKEYEALENINVAALATYAFFFFALFGRQNLIPEMKAGKEIDLMVGQDLMRPFGLDDDDIELNYILDRNIATSFAIVNRLQLMNLPELEDDHFWKHKEGKIEPLPHTIYSRELAEHRPKLHSYVRVGASEDTNSHSLASCISNDKEKRHINW
ncbi:Bestrophin [Necator americanus]|uniref:Bestrophin homolog n=1 Tax=Necator americanus TaxID=51031 RepID=W2SZ27_NECAM|nr:Bestrophin [Necator americanus]ETN73927.1 Bestrophin [Necator americanus]